MGTFRNDIISYLDATSSAEDDQYIGCCPAHGDQRPSLSIKFLPGKRNPLLHCFSGCTYAEMKEAFIELEMWDHSEGFEKLDTDEEPNKLRKEKKEFRLPWLSDIENTPAEKYLKSRGLEIYETFPSLKYLSTTYYKDRGSNPDDKAIQIPALWALLTDENNIVVGANKVYLTEEGAKAAVAESKKIGGTLSKAAVKFGAHAGKRLHLAEGVETALAIYQVLGEPTWAVCSALNLSSQVIPEYVEDIVIWADKDISKTGEIQARKAAKKFREMGKTVQVQVPFLNENRASCDWLDVLNEDAGKISFALEMPGTEELNETSETKIDQKPLAAKFGQARTPLGLTEWLEDQLMFRQSV